MLKATGILRLDGLKKFSKKIKSGSPAIKKTLKQWAVRYRAFLQQRFNTHSKGGGDWPPLKPSTIARRKKGKGKGDVAILRDTGTLFGALNPVFAGQPGAMEKYNALSVEVGYGGPGAHPNGGQATIADIASFHDTGAGYLPQRKIIVPPDAHTRDLMAKDAERNINKEAKDDIG